MFNDNRTRNGELGGLGFRSDSDLGRGRGGGNQGAGRSAVTATRGQKHRSKSEWHDQNSHTTPPSKITNPANTKLFRTSTKTAAGRSRRPRIANRLESWLVLPCRRGEFRRHLLPRLARKKQWSRGAAELWG